MPQVALVTWLVEQTLPQPPQLLLSVLVFTSQPLVCLLLSQSAKPGLQAPLHPPEEQVGVMMLLFEQSVPQAPQLFGSVVRLTSQPSVSLLPLQSAKPALQAPLQVPPPQLGVAMLFFEQARPQAPQFAGSI